MFVLQTFGAAGLTNENGDDIEPVLRQPKLLALLVYLAMPAPGTWHRRDAIVAMFWPDFDQARARSSLRTALHQLRTHVGSAIRTRGVEEVSVDPALLRMDAADFASHAASRRFDAAIEAYTGDFLPALHISGSDEFIEWCERERARLRTLAAHAALELSHERERAHDIVGAVAALRRAQAIDPDDASPARRIALLMEQIPRPVVRESAPPHTSPVAQHPPVRRRPALWASVAVLGAAALMFTLPRIRASAGAQPNEQIIVMPAANETGDDAMSYIANDLTTGVARRLDGVGGINILSSVHSAARARTLRLSLVRGGDSLEVRTTIEDTRGTRSVVLPARRFLAGNLRETESIVAASVAAAIFRRPIPALPGTGDTAIAAESYRLVVAGWHELFTTQNLARAQELFDDAIREDQSNARAWSGLSSVWAAQTITARVPFETGYTRAMAAARRALAIDSTQGSALANMAILAAIRERHLGAGLDLIRRAERLDPSNAEVFMLKSALYFYAWEWDAALDAARVARDLDLFSPFYIEREATINICAGRPEAALRLYRDELPVNPRADDARFGVARALALLGRFDEAIDSWRAVARMQGDSITLRDLAGAHGAAGFWSARHAAGKRALQTYREQLSKGAWVSPLREMQATFAAGDSTAGFALLEQGVRERYFPLYKLPCMPDFDEVRGTPHFGRLMREMGGLPR